MTSSTSWVDVNFAEYPVPREYERIFDRLADGWAELRDRARG